MAPKRLTGKAGAVLAVTGAAAALTGGVAAAQGAHAHATAPAHAKSLRPGSVVTGHTVRIAPSGARSNGPAAGKKSRAGSASVSGHTVHMRPS